MNPSIRFMPRKRESGQTLIVAMIILGLLLILGFVFLGIVNSNVKGSATNNLRAEANDAAEAGIRYAHSQLVKSPLGADWRGTPVALTETAPNSGITADPDAYYLRQPDLDANNRPTRKIRPDAPNDPSPFDLGGPDGKGPFIRLNFRKARALVRVSYAPTDANIFSASPLGAIRNPGEAHNYLVIESIGRDGVVDLNDPTTLNPKGAIQYKNFASDAGLWSALSALKKFDSQFANSRKLIAFATIGITDYARFITNKFEVSRAADIGIPPEMGASYAGLDVSSAVPLQIGTPNGPALSNNGAAYGYGSFRSNADLLLYGQINFFLNKGLGEKVMTSGSVTSADKAKVTLNFSTFSKPTSGSAGAYVNQPSVNLGQPNSRGAFNSVLGLFLDGSSSMDSAGGPRGVPPLTPPSLLEHDVDTKENRYVAMTRGSGYVTSAGNTGAFGQGGGPYIDNFADKQDASDETSRKITEGENSLLHDWFNPNSGDTNSGWKGPFYIPRGAFVQLLPDGFTIQRSETWKNIDGSDSGLNTLRFRIGTVNGVPYIVNNLSVDSQGKPLFGGAGPTINSKTSSIPFDRGQPFNGVLYFEGNVRVRGIIPTDVQMTLVSNATIYIEGSILKGVVGNDVTQLNGQEPYNNALGRMSKSTLMLAAKDYVALNTTQFLGLSPGQSPKEVNDQQNLLGFTAVRMETTGSGTDNRLLLTGELGLDPEPKKGFEPTGFDPSNPTTWKPFNLEYGMPTKLLIKHTMDDGTASASFITLNVNDGFGTNSSFVFPGDDRGAGTDILTNTASTYLGSGANPITLYGLGTDPWQRYNKLETRAFTLIDPATTSYSNGLITALSSAVPARPFGLFAQSPNDFTIRPGSINGVATNDYDFAGAALVPGDIRIEASIYAEEGSFVVIPGRWFNPNTNDNRADYVNGTGIYQGVTSTDEKNYKRVTAFGVDKDTPFYGEPLDIRITIVGAVSENMPPPMAIQSEWLKKWGWIPGDFATTGTIPNQHQSIGAPVQPNIIIKYDPVLASGRVLGVSSINDFNKNPQIRADSLGRALPPMPRLPVSPQLTYFGEVQ